MTNPRGETSLIDRALKAGVGRWALEQPPARPATRKRIKAVRIIDWPWLELHPCDFRFENEVAVDQALDLAMDAAVAIPVFQADDVEAGGGGHLAAEFDCTDGAEADVRSESRKQEKGRGEQECSPRTV